MSAAAAVGVCDTVAAVADACGTFSVVLCVTAGAAVLVAAAGCTSALDTRGGCCGSVCGCALGATALPDSMRGVSLAGAALGASDEGLEGALLGAAAAGVSEAGLLGPALGVLAAAVLEEEEAVSSCSCSFLGWKAGPNVAGGWVAIGGGGAKEKDSLDDLTLGGCVPVCGPLCCCATGTGP